MRLTAYRMIMAEGSLDALKNWEILCRTLKSYDCLPDIVLASGTPYKNDLKRYFLSHPDCINVETGRYTVLSNPLERYHFIQTLIDETQPGPDLWKDVALSFSQIHGFRQAFIYDLNYDLW
jgi:hypothetical protein